MFSHKVVSNLGKSSAIRAMFEQGEALRKIHGPDKVYDFSLGNPDIEPPESVKRAIVELLHSDKAIHKYMNNAGYLDVRQKLAESISTEMGVKIEYKHVVMTCGAAGAINIAFKTLLNPGDEVIVISPFFVEYQAYIENHLGKMVVVKSNPETFMPDISAIEKALTENTKAIIINSPNNPTGVVYSQEVLEEMANLFGEYEKKYNHRIFVIADEPYKKIVYDSVVVPSVLKIFKNSIVVNSFSKTLSLPGARIGYAAVSPSMDNVDMLMDGLIFSNRVLGFVNAPSLFQKVIAQTLDESVDTMKYQKRRDLLYNHLISLGLQCVKPQGAFYLFPKSPIEDDVEFAARAVKYNILVVPGSGFGCPGHFRIAYCVDTKIIENSLTAFEALVRCVKL